MSDPASAPPPDPALLAQVQAEAGVRTTVEASLADYARHVKDRVWGLISDLLDQGGFVEGAQVVGLWVVGGLLPALLAAVVLRALWRRRRAAARAVSDPAGSAPAASASRREDPVEAALAAGEARVALGAAWEDLARSLGGRGIGRFRPGQTEREFEVEVRRRQPDWEGLGELRALRREVVVGRYGPEAPTVETARALAVRARDLAGRSPAAPEAARG